MLNIPLLITAGGMEFCLLSGLISVLLVPAWGFSFPVYDSALIFILAAALNRLSRGRGWLVIQVLILHILGFIGAIVLAVQTYYYPHDSLFNINLFWSVFTRAEGMKEWLYLLAVIASVLVLWYGGMAFSRRSRDYEIICIRFDKGIGVFAILLFLEGVGLKIGGQPLVWFIIFFIFSIMAMGIARGAGDGKKEYISGYAKIGLITGFVLLTIIILSLFIFFGIPYLTGAAETGYSIIKIIARPLLAILVSILKFLFGHAAPTTDGGTPVSGGQNMAPAEFEQSWLAALIEKILGHLLIVILVLLAAVLIGLSIYYLYRWLFSRTDDKKEGGEGLSIYFKRLYELIKRLAVRLIGRSPYRTLRTYKKLLRWGKICGIRKIDSETPREYGRRLAGYFPSLEQEVGDIIEPFNREIYAGIRVPEEELKQAKRSWCRIRKPGNLLYLFKQRRSLELYGQQD